MKEDHGTGDFKILRAVSAFIIPIILLYGAYLTVNGHRAAGGGFPGGTIIGVAVILFNIAFGSEVTDKFITFKGCVRTISLSLLAYLILRGATFFMGANGMRAIIPLGTPGNIFSGGLILPLNICVALVIASMMYMLYSLFSHWGGRLD